MTRRDRLTAKADRLREWAATREARASAQLASQPELRSDFAFASQPGHIPARARMNAADDRAHESLEKAEGMRGRAAGIEQALDRSVYSDDPDAVDAIRARVAELEAKRERMKRVNALYRKGDAAGLAALGLDLSTLQARVASAGLSYVKAPHEGWELSNLAGNIGRLKKRIEEIERQRVQTDEAAAAGGVAIKHPGHGYALVDGPSGPPAGLRGGTHRARDRGMILPCWHTHSKGLIAFVDPATHHAEIDQFRPADERPTRHQRLRPVAGALPRSVLATGAAAQQAWAATRQARAVYRRAQMAYQRACERHRPAIEALHAAECGCGQAWDGEMVFPAKE